VLDAMDVDHGVESVSEQLVCVKGEIKKSISLRVAVCVCVCVCVCGGCCFVRKLRQVGTSRDRRLERRMILTSDRSFLMFVPPRPIMAPASLLASSKRKSTLLTLAFLLMTLFCSFWESSAVRFWPFESI
jgi:hypothetical protein